MRRAALLTVLLLSILAVPFVASADSPPPGATAQCRDGSYSFSQHHSGTCSHHGGVATWLDGTTAGTGTGTSTAGPAPVVGQTVLLARRTRSRACVRSARPDRRCSPGAYYTGLTKSVLCSSTFRTGSVRNVPQAEKFAVEREYGMTPRPYGRTMEIDHIVSLELGGSNDVANLYPEPGSGKADYHVKDKLENAVAALVCSGKMSLRAAQRGIASNWEALYLSVFGFAATG